MRLDLRFITLIARRLESPAICRCRYKGGTFSSRLLKTLSEPTTSHTLLDAQPAKLPVGGSSFLACRQKCQNKLLGYAGNQPIKPPLINLKVFEYFPCQWKCYSVMADTKLQIGSRIIMYYAPFDLSFLRTWNFRLPQYHC